MSKGFVVAEQGHVVLNIAPNGTQTTAAGCAACFCMKNYGHATIIAAAGVGSAATMDITLYEHPDSTGSSGSAIDFQYARESTSAGDTLDAALAWASTVSVVGTAAAYAVIEVDADTLTDGDEWISVHHSACSSSVAIMAILSGGRYQEDITATAIA